MIYFCVMKYSKRYSNNPFVNFLIKVIRFPFLILGWILKQIKKFIADILNKVYSNIIKFIAGLIFLVLIAVFAIIFHK